MAYKSSWGGVGSGIGVGGAGSGLGIGGNSYVPEKQPPSFTLIEPPDDRYLPGYRKVDEDGNTTIVGPRLKDLNVSFSLYGLPIPISHGIRRLPGNIIWAMPLREQRVKKRQAGSYGKGGSSGPTTKEINFVYYANFAVSFGKSASGEASNRQIVRAWANGTLVNDRRPVARGRTAAGFKYRFYPGDENQVPDPLIEEDLGVGATPAYRGLMYVVVQDLPVAQFGNTIPSITVEIADSTTQEATNEYLNLPSQVSSTNMQVDWGSGRVFSRGTTSPVNNDKIYECDILNGYERTIQVTDGQGSWDGLMDSNICFVPWLNMFVVASDAIATQNQGLFLLDANSGSVLGRFGSDTGDVKSGPLDITYENEFPGTGAGQIRGIFPVYIPTSTGTNTVIAVLNYNVHTSDRNYLTFYQLIPPGQDVPPGYLGGASYARQFLDGGLGGTRTRVDGEWAFVHIGQVTLMNSGPDERVFYSACVGANTENSAEVFFCASGKIYKLLVSTAGVKAVPPRGEFIDVNGNGVICYYPGEDALIFCNGSQVVKYNCRDGTQIGNTVTQAHAIGTNVWRAFSQSVTAFGTISLPGSGLSTDIYEIDLASMTSRLAATAVPGFSGTYSHDSVGSSQLRIVSGGTDIVRVFYNGLGTGRATLAEAIKTIAREAGLDPDVDLDISPNIDDSIDGIYITQRTSFRDTLDAIATIYLLDIVESGGVIKITRKQQSLTSANYDFEIPETELVAESENGITLRSRRENEFNLPKAVEFTYLSRNRSYQYTVQRAQRSSYPDPTQTSEYTLSVTLPLIVNDAEAKTQALKVLYQGSWESRVTYQFRLPWKYTYLDPGDVGTIDSGEITYLVKIKEMTINSDWTIDVKAVGFMSDEPFEIEADGGAAYEQTLPQFSLPVVDIYDMPLLDPGVEPTSLFKEGVFYVSIRPGNKNIENWRGAYAETSKDKITWAEIGQNIDIPCLMVVTGLSEVPAIPQTYLPEAAITVKMLSSREEDLVSITYDQLLEGGNAAIVRNSVGVCEVIQFQTVTDNLDGSYTLTGIIRGQRNTDFLIGTATDALRLGSTILLIDQESLIPQSLSLEEVATKYYIRAVNFNRPALENPTGNFTFQGLGAACIPPVNAQIEWMGTPGVGNLRVTFSARHRTGVNWDDDEATEWLDDSFQDGTTFKLYVYQDADYSVELLTKTETGGLIQSDRRYYIELTAAELTTHYGTATPEHVFLGLERIRPVYNLSQGVRKWTFRVPY